MASKTIRMKLDINHLFEEIEKVISNSRSKIARENGWHIAVGMDLLIWYLQQIGERAIKRQDDELIDLLLDLHVLKEDKEDGK